MALNYTMPAIQDIENAYQWIRPFIHRTPVLTNASLNESSGAEVLFKCENFQKASSFKVRGAIMSMNPIPSGPSKVP